MESLERILAMYIKRWWNFEILSGTEGLREVHQILEIQRNMEDFEDCKGIRVSPRSLKGFQSPCLQGTKTL